MAWSPRPPRSSAGLTACAGRRCRRCCRSRGRSCHGGGRCRQQRQPDAGGVGRLLAAVGVDRTPPVISRLSLVHSRFRVSGHGTASIADRSARPITRADRHDQSVHPGRSRHGGDPDPPPRRARGTLIRGGLGRGTRRSRSPGRDRAKRVGCRDLYRDAHRDQCRSETVCDAHHAVHRREDVAARPLAVSLAIRLYRSRYQLLAPLLPRAELRRGGHRPKRTAAVDDVTVGVLVGEPRDRWLLGDTRL